MKINERLKAARLKKELTQQDVAEVLHVGRTTISSWEVGRTYPDLEMLVSLSDLYDISLDVLLKEDITMVENVTKEVKQKRKYQLIFYGFLLILGSFLLINLIWYGMNVAKYNYVKQNWQEDKRFYSLSDGEMVYHTSKMNTAALFRNSYLRKQKLSVMGYYEEEETDLFLAKDEERITVSVPVGRAFGFVTVDQEMNYLGDYEHDSGILNPLVHPEDVDKVNQYLAKNKLPLKKLYKNINKQYELINR